jgi:hypothetical protein
MAYTGTPAETLKIWQDELDNCLAARAAFSSGAQSYKIGSRELTRVNLKDLNDRIDYLMRCIATSGQRRSYSAVPMDF